MRQTWHARATQTRPSEGETDLTYFWDVCSGLDSPGGGRSLGSYCFAEFGFSHEQAAPALCTDSTALFSFRSFPLPGSKLCLLCRGFARGFLTHGIGTVRVFEYHLPYAARLLWFEHNLSPTSLARPVHCSAHVSRHRPSRTKPLAARLLWFEHNTLIASAHPQQLDRVTLALHSYARLIWFEPAPAFGHARGSSSDSRFGIRLRVRGFNPAHAIPFFLHHQGQRSASVAQGRSLVFIAFPPPVWALDILDLFSSQVLAFFVSLLCTLVLALAGALLRALPGRHIPLGRLLLLPTQGTPPCMILAGAFASPSLTRYVWIPQPRKGTPRTKGKKQVRRSGLIQILCLKALCLLAAPMPVWAVPTQTQDLIRGLSHAASERLARAPEELPNPPNAIGHVHLGRDSNAAQQPLTSPEPDNMVMLPLPAPQAAGYSTSFWLGVDLLAPGYLGHQFGVRCSETPLLAHVTSQVAQYANSKLPGCMRVAPVRFPRHLGFAEFVAFPTVIEDMGAVAVVLDMSRVGGHYFCQILKADTTLAALNEALALLPHAHSEDWFIHVGSELLDNDQNQILPLAHGEVITVAFNQHCGPRNHILQLFQPEAHWETLHQLPTQELSPALAVLHDGSLTPLHGANREARLQDFIQLEARRFGTSPCLYRHATFPSMHDLLVYGIPCDGIAVIWDSTMRPEQERTHVTLVDARPVGKMPFAFFSDRTTPSVEDIASAVELPFDMHNRVTSHELLDRHTGDLQSHVVLYPSSGLPAFHPTDSSDAMRENEHCIPTSSQDAEAHPLTGNQALAFEDDGDEDASSELSSSEDHDVRHYIQFLVLIPDYSAHEVTVSLPPAVGVDEALNEISLQLPDDIYRLHSVVLPLHPQPGLSWGAVLALPNWATAEMIGALDMTLVDGRFFATVLPHTATRADLCSLGDLDDTDDFDIWIGNQCLLYGNVQDFPMQAHLCITFVPRQGPVPSQTSFSELLASDEHWDPESTLPRGPPDNLVDSVCLVLESGCHRFKLLPGRSQHHAHDVANALCIPHHWFYLRAARPRVTNAAIKGYRCTGVAAVSDRIANVPMPPRRAGPVLFAILVDARAMLLGWDQWMISDHQCSHSELVEHYSTFAPADFQVQIEGAALEGDQLQVIAGQVLTVHWVPCTPLSEQCWLDAADDPDSLNEDPDDVADTDRELTVRGSPAAGHSRHSDSRIAEERSRSPRRCPIHHPDPCGALKQYCAGSDFAFEVNFIKHHSFAAGFLLEDTQPSVNCPFDWPAAHVLQARCFQKHAPTACKLLLEPTCSTAGQTRRLAALRDITRRLGGHWPFATSEDDDSSVSLSDSADSVVSQNMQWICFVVIVPGYVSEYLTVLLALPATLEEAIEAVDEARSIHQQILFPHLLPASPQPCARNGILVASPHWQSHSMTICIDTTELDGRLFSVSAPEYANRDTILRLSAIPLFEEVEIFVGPTFEPLAAGIQVHLFPAVTVKICLPGSSVPPTFSLASMLSVRREWSADPELPPLSSTNRLCVVSEDDVHICHFDSGSPMSYKAQSARSAGLPHDCFGISPAQPRVQDLSLHGHPCRTALGVSLTRRPVCLIDCRPLLLGWMALPIADGLIDVRALLAELDDATPLFWSPLLQDIPNSSRHVRADQGEVFVARLALAPQARPSLSRELIPENQDALPSPSHEEIVSSPPMHDQVAYVQHCAEICMLFLHLASLCAFLQACLTVSSVWAWSLSNVGGTDSIPNTISSSPLESAHGGTTSAAQDPPTESGQHAAESVRPIVAMERDRSATMVWHFILLTPNMEKEFVNVTLPVHASVPEALAAVAAARSFIRTNLFEHIIPVDPQPARDFGTLIAVPRWASDVCAICMNLHHLDGRIFTMVLPYRLNRESLLLHAGLDSASDCDVFVGDSWVPLIPGQVTRLWLGLTISFVAHRQVFNPEPSLRGLLARSDSSHEHPDLPVSSHGRNVWVLTDGMPRLFDASNTDRDSFRRHIAAYVSISIDRLSLQPPLPMLQDFDHQGRLCIRTVVATGQVSRVPVPPGRLLPPRCIYILDRRPILQGVTWGFAEHNQIAVEPLVQVLSADAPARHHAVVVGGTLEHRWDRSFIHVHPGQVLLVHFVPDDSESGAEDDAPPPWDTWPDWPDPEADQDGDEDTSDTYGGYGDGGTGSTEQAPSHPRGVDTPQIHTVSGIGPSLRSNNARPAMPTTSARVRGSFGRPPGIFGLSKVVGPWLQLFILFLAAPQIRAVQIHLPTPTDTHVLANAEAKSAHTRAAGVATPVRRPIATPCRHKDIRTGSAPLSDQYLASGFPRHRETTLELAAARSDCVAFVLARDTLDILQQHWTDQQNHQQKQPKARFHLNLEKAIPAASPCPWSSQDEAAVTFGNTRLGFSWNQLWDLVEVKVQLQAWDSQHAVLKDRCSGLLQTIAEAAGAHPQSDLIFYTDGSFTPDHSDNPAIAGWAFVLLQCGKQQAWTAEGTVPPWILGPKEALSGPL